LMLQHRVLMRPFIPRDDPEYRIASEADRDMQILAFVFDQLMDFRDDEQFRIKVGLLLRDHALPQDGSEQSSGRDTQFELLVAAVCKSAGLVPLGFEEPDLTCTFNGVKFGIAAKRLKSMAKMRTRLKSATEQIKRAQLPGVIAVDASVGLNPHNEPLAVEHPE